ncbi:MAG: 8-oxo-dGTP diphosphatase [Clostridia bacterium]|nr:8-oxo-dGTP diphosphatase [Clostridia bacterium]
MKNSTLCYIEKDGRYLMLHRVKKENDCNKDKWIGVGGKFEDGESPEECMIREVREETGLTVNSWNYKGIVTFVSDVWETEYMHLFTCDDFFGIPIDSRDCDEGNLEWVEISKISSLPLWEGDKIFLDLLKRDTGFFSLKLQYKGDNLVYACLDGRVIKNNLIDN